ncbi:ABC transporter substrate-binding protein [Halosimplex sp. J119]
MANGRDSQSQRSSDSTVSNGMTRRKWLALSGAGLAGLAGCNSEDTEPPSSTEAMSGDGSGSGDGGSTDPSDGASTISGSPRDGELTRFQQNIPSDFNWNFFITGYQAGVARQFYHEIRPHLDHTLENWEYDTENNVERWTFPENLTWWSGDAVTAEDEYTKWEIDRLQNPSDSDLAEVRLVDDYTLEFEYKDQQNPTIVERSNALGTPIAVPRWKFESWLQRYQDASSQDERDSITEELTQTEITTTTVLEEGLGNHPYELVEANAQEMVFELRDDHPWATEDQVQRVRTRTITESSSLIIQQDKIDMRGGFLPQDFQGPDHLKEIITRPTLQMSKVMFNHTNDHLGNRTVRRALAHLIDNNNIIQNQSPNATTVEKQTGMGDNWVREWCGDDFYEQLHTYPNEADPEGATQLLEEAGYSKQNGEWVDPDGEAVSFSVLGMNWGAFVDGARTVNAQLDQFGFNVEFQALEAASFRERAWGSMEHDLSFYYQNNWINHPVSYFRPHYPGGLRLAEPDSFRSDIEGWLDEGLEESQHTGIPLTPTIPSEPGAMEVSGDGEEVNLYESWDNIHKAQNRDETVSNLKKLLRYWNFDLPHFVSLQMRGAWWGDTRDFEMPQGNEDLKIYASNDVALRHGHIKYNYE